MGVLNWLWLFFFFQSVVFFSIGGAFFFVFFFFLKKKKTWFSSFICGCFVKCFFAVFLQVGVFQSVFLKATKRRLLFLIGGCFPNRWLFFLSRLLFCFSRWLLKKICFKKSCCFKKVANYIERNTTCKEKTNRLTWKKFHHLEKESIILKKSTLSPPKKQLTKKHLFAKKYRKTISLKNIFFENINLYKHITWKRYLYNYF